MPTRVRKPPTDLLETFRDIARQVHAAWPDIPVTQSTLSGLADPVGPRNWGDHGQGYRVCLVKFIPGPDGKPINHGLGVDFQSRGLVIRAWGHNRGAMETQLSVDPTPEELADLLMTGVRFFNLMPRRPRHRSCVDILCGNPDPHTHL